MIKAAKSFVATEAPSVIQSEPINRLLIDTPPPPLPKFMRYYSQVSYVLYAIHIIYSVIYLIHVAVIQSSTILHIQYELVYDYHNFNSYSILCPILGVIFVAIFAYHVKYRVKLDDGDFFGLVGILLLLCLIMCYDAIGVYHLYEKAVKINETDWKVIEDFKDTETNELAWQYAWSTKPTCARYHAMMNRKYHNAEPDVNRGPGLIEKKDHHDINYWMYAGKKKEDLLKALSLSKTYSLEHDDNGGGENKEETSADEQTYITVCGSSWNLQNRTAADPRDWMDIMHQKLRCCGPRGWDHYKDQILFVSLHCKQDKKDLEKGQQPIRYSRSCTKPFHLYLMNVFMTAFVIMLLMTISFLICIVTAIFHFAAMKFDEKLIHKEYSLLNVNENEGVTRLDIQQDHSVVRTKSQLGDPVEHLFSQANIRAERASNAEMHLPAILVEKERKFAAGHPHHVPQHLPLGRVRSAHGGFKDHKP